MTTNDREYWFEPKSYGYGAGLPITWQAWLLCLVYCAVVTLAAWLLLERTIIGFVAIVVTATAAFLIQGLSASDGDWICGAVRLSSWPPGRGPAPGRPGG